MTGQQAHELAARLRERNPTTSYAVLRTDPASRDVEPFYVRRMDGPQADFAQAERDWNMARAGRAEREAAWMAKRRRRAVTWSHPSTNPSNPSVLTYLEM
jgi:hypothetical protein